MAALSSYLQNALLNEVLRNVNYTPVGTVWLALYTSNPTSADTGTEVTGGSYARQSLSFAAASGGTCVNNTTINFPGMPAITITHLGVRDASSAGNLLFYGALASARTTLAGDTFTINSGDLNLALT